MTFVSMPNAGLLVALAAVSCSGDGPRPPTGTVREPIQMGTPATAYPEAVYVQVGDIVPCSGVVVAPRVVLTAGHCRAADASYVVTAPNADGQVAHASADWSPFTGEARTTPDVRLLFLDTPIHLATYPILAKAEVAAGTAVVDLGRALNGSIDDADYVSPPVTISGDATALGFAYNYEALPDISEDGDSGGPIEIAPTTPDTPHTVVAIVDTDTTEQGIPEATPIDMFARIDVVYTDIVAQIATHGLDAGSFVDAGAGEAGAGRSGSPRTPGGGGCRASAARPERSPLASLLALAILLARRGARRCAPG